MKSALSWLLLLDITLIIYSPPVIALVCVNQPYCVTDADCIPGTYCTNKQVSNGILTYSQCLDNPTNASCIAPSGTCGGIELAFIMKIIITY